MGFSGKKLFSFFFYFRDVVHVRLQSLDGIVDQKVPQKKAVKSPEILENGFKSSSSRLSFSCTNPFRSFDDDTLSDTQREILFEETPSTRNAMVAVMGYDPKDEVLYCKHLDPKTGRCFKGSQCTKIHQKPLEDGWSRDKELVYTEIPSKLKVPCIDEKLTIEATHAEDIHIFYGHISNKHYHSPKEPSLKAFHREINRPECIQKYKTFNNNIMPGKNIPF